MTLRVPSAKDRKIHGDRVIAIEDCCNGYENPIHTIDLERLDEEQIKEIKSWDVK